MITPVSGGLVTRTQAAVPRAVDYLRGKQSYNGGFCFYRRGPVDQPNVKDTYHAVAALALAKRQIPRADEVVRYLNRVDTRDAGALFYYAFALDCLGRSADIQKDKGAQILRRLPEQRHSDSRVPAESWLESTLKTVLLKRRFAEVVNASEIIRSLVNLKHAQGGYGTKPNLEDTCTGIRLLDALCDHSVERQDTRSFVDSLQKPSIGFTATSDSLYTNLAIIAAGVESSAMLNLELRHPADILSFVLACQAADGSFSRTPVALPNIELTHQALEIIARIAPETFFC
jgi:hypothetical protein